MAVPGLRRGMGASMYQNTINAVFIFSMVWIGAITMSSVFSYPGSVTRVVETTQGEVMLTLDSNASDREMMHRLTQVPVIDVESEFLSYLNLISEERQLWRKRLLDSVWVAIIPVFSVWLFVGAGLLIIRIARGRRPPQT